MSEIVITGIGSISAIGNNVDEMFSSLKEGKHGIKPISIIDTKLSDEYLAGEVKLSNDELSVISGIKSMQSRTTLLASAAISEIIKNAGLSENEIKNTGLISSTTVGGMDMTEANYYNFKNKERLEFATVHPSGEHSNRVARLFGLEAYVSTVSTACSSASNAMIIGARLIKSKQVDRVIVGGADALSKFTLNGFKSLMILDPNHCKPFDKNRKGLNMGEAAGYLLIESKESAIKRGTKIYAKLSGYSNVNEAFHQTASSPNGDGAYSAMKKAIAVAGLKESDIQYINAHGTGTNNNDNSESLAIDRVFADDKGTNNVIFSSTKAFTGHTLAAAGGIEAIISILCINNSFIPANLNFEDIIDGAKLTPTVESINNISINNVLSNSFGFGGNNTSLLFSKFEKE